MRCCFGFPRVALSRPVELNDATCASCDLCQLQSALMALLLFCKELVTAKRCPTSGKLQKLLMYQLRLSQRQHTMACQMRRLPWICFGHPCVHKRVLPKTGSQAMHVSCCLRARLSSKLKRTKIRNHMLNVRFAQVLQTSRLCTAQV